MAIYFFDWSVVKRSQQASAVAAAAYRHGEEMKDEVDDETHNYLGKNDLRHSEITLPEKAPSWAQKAFGRGALGRLLDGRLATESILRQAIAKISCKLWNNVQHFEVNNNNRAATARTAGKMTFALPVELGRDAQVELGRSFVTNSLAGRGAIVDWVLHDPKPTAEGVENPHIHAMVTLRHLDADGWGKKNRIWDQRSLFHALRGEWANEVNIALEKAGRPERVDHRRLADQGIELQPVSYDEKLADALEERGEVLRVKELAELALYTNRDYLRFDPEHALVVVASERTVFTAEDVADVFRRNGFDATETDDLTGQAMNSMELIGVLEGQSTGPHLFTTRAQMEVESNVMIEALALAGSRVEIDEVGAGEAALKSVRTEAGQEASTGLDEGQRKALEEMISTRRMALVTGVAGAGKTRVIEAAAQVWKDRGFEVLGGAISGKASQGLSEIEGMQVASLAAWEARWARGIRPTQGKFIIIIDEAGMVGTATWDRIQHQVARMGGVLRPVGDPEQLQPVLDTNVFGRLLDQIGGAVIGTVRRMRSHGDRSATQVFARGAEGADIALAYYREKGAILDTDTVSGAIQALAQAYYPSERSAPQVSGSPLHDPIENGSGPIMLSLPPDPARDPQEGQRYVASTAPRRSGTAQKGPSVAVIREALTERAEDLFRLVYGEPLRPGAKEWQARERTSQVMRMQGPRRGLWHDYSAGEGGDLLDLVARNFCGLNSAKVDFPGVMKEAARYCGIATDQPVDETLVKARALARKQQAEEAEKQEAARRAALVETLSGQARPADGTAAAGYLASRGVTELPGDSIGWLPPVPGAAVRSPEMGALVVWARNADGVRVGGQRILVNADGTKHEVEVRKPSFGALRGAHAVFPARNEEGAKGAQPLIIAEGPESALSIWQATGHETWAVFGASNWNTISLPRDRPVILAPDRDAPDSPAGQAFRKAVLHHLGEGVVNLGIAVAPEPEGSKADLNDTLQRAGSAAVRKAIANARPVKTRGEKDLFAAPLVQAEPTRIALGYTGQDVDALNDALRARAIDTGRVDQDQEIHYGDIVRVDRRGLVPKRYTADMRFAPGDRVIFTQAHRDFDIPKSSFATIEATRAGEIDLALDGDVRRAVTIDMNTFDHFDYGYAATTHKLQGVTVDHAYALAHQRMSRPISYVMMSRHRESVAMYVPQERFTDTTFEACARRDDYLELGWAGEDRRRSAIAGPAFTDSEFGARVDALLPNPDEGAQAPVSEVSFLRDSHLLAVMRRTAGLLSANWADGDPDIVQDDRGYAENPTRVIDDLIAHRSTFRAEQVAERLSRVAPHPETFVRLFRNAMEHPDLIALGGDDGPSTRPRVYSARAQVDLELGALDQGMALGLAHRDAGLGINEQHVTDAIASAGLNERGSNSVEAVRHAAIARQVQFITGGSGSGKTTVLSVLATAHGAADRQVHCLAPTRETARVFAAGSGRPTRTVAGFIHALNAGRISLDARSVILLDDARMLAAEDTRDLLDVVRQSGAKLIAAWDPAQVGAIKAGRLFDDLEIRLGSHRLEGVPRADTSSAREITGALPNATGSALAEQLVAAECVTAAGPRAEAIDILVEGYLKDTNPDRVVIVSSQAAALDVNRAIRARLHPEQNPGSSVDQGPVDANEVTAATLAVGDRVRLGRWYTPARLPAGTVGTVVEADDKQVRIRLGAPADTESDRLMVVNRDDPEFRCGFSFAQTIRQAKGQGSASVHVLAHSGMNRCELGTAIGLHTGALRIVVPSVKGGVDDSDPLAGAQELLSAVLSREEQDVTVAGHVLDPALAEEQVSGDIKTLRRHARGAGTPWAVPDLDSATHTVSEADLIKNPERILPVMAARDVRFTIADVRREIAARVASPDVDIDKLVSGAMGSSDIVWLDDAAEDGAPCFTTRSNENAAYLAAHPEHILTLIGAERTVFTLQELRSAFEQRLPTGSDLREPMAAVLDNPALVALDSWGAEGAQLFTTRAHVITEQRLIRNAGLLARRRIRWDNGAEDAELVSSRLPYGKGGFTEGQREAGRAMLNAEGLVLVRGVAGSGKTTVLKDVAAIWKARGYDVCGGAISGRAARDLGDGVEDLTVASLAAWEARWAQGWRPSGKGLVFVMDEAGMVGSDVWSRVQDRIAVLGGKLIAVGDPAQLQPVSSSNAWMAVQSKVGCTVIDHARRQVSEQERRWTEGFAAGGSKASAAIKGYADSGAVRFEDTAEIAIQRLADSYYTTGKPGETRLALAYTRDDVARLNTAIRQKALARGVVNARTEHSYGTAERMVRGKQVSRDLVFGEGDRVVFEAANAGLGITRNTTGTVIQTGTARLVVRLDGAEAQEIELVGDEIKVLDHGYATTLHRSQGVTVDHALTIAHGYMDRHLIYVAMSRHVKSAQMFVPGERVDNVETLANMAQRSSWQSLETRAELARSGTAFGMGVKVTTDGDRLSVTSTKTDPATGVVTGFEDDPYLNAVLGRITGLLASEYHPETAPVGDDPDGYAQAPQRVIDNLIRRRATFGAEDIARELTNVVRCPDTFARMFREAMRHPDLTRLTEHGAGGERLYTTKAHLELELRVMDSAVRIAFSSHKGAVKLSDRDIKAISRERHLTDDQVEALRLAASGQRLSIVRGGSGSGKTFMAAALADLHTRQGLDVIAVSHTGRGVDRLRSEGAVRSMTLAGLERQVAEKRTKLTAKSVILLDDAGQVGAEAAERLFAMVEKSGAKVIALQDSDPHAPFEAMPVFRTLEARIGSIDLGESRRQKNPELREALRHLSDRDTVDKAVEMLDERGVFSAGQSRGRAIRKLATAYVQDKLEDKIVLAHSRRDVTEINKSVRAQLDELFPDRMAHVPKSAKAGSVGDLRVGDRIRLTEGYRRAGLGIGTEAMVERRSRRQVVLRIGSGDEARHLKLKVSDEDFRYGFAFADTIHAARGRGTASVHMLASPGMNRRLLQTGAAMSESVLNIVVPVPKDRVLPAVSAITRKDDSVQAALDYGVDATHQTRVALRGGDRNKGRMDKPAPGALMDGLDRVLAWVADSLDGGLQGVREQAPTTRRLESLRTGVLVELSAVHQEQTGQPLGVAERQALGERIDQLVVGPNTRRFLGQGWAVRAFEAETERGYIPGVSRSDQMVARVLKRGVEMAEATGEDEMQNWFSRTRTIVGESIDEQKAQYARANAAPRPAAKPVVTDLRDVQGMALQLAQAISERVPRRDPVHEMDHIPILEEMLRKADPGGSRPISDAEVFQRVPHVSWTTPETHKLDQVVANVMAKGPLMEREDVLGQRDALFDQLDQTEEPTIPAREFVQQLTKVFTHKEVAALNEPETPWPDSLPERYPDEREVISKRVREITRKGKEMEQSDVLKDLAMGSVKPSTLDQFKAAFSIEEIGALTDPDAEVPESLPALGPAARKKIAETLNKALQDPAADRESPDETVASPDESKVEVTPEPVCDPEEVRVRDLALSMTSAVSQHINGYNPVHEGNLLERIVSLLKATPGARLEGDTAENVARNLARKRVETEVRREVLVKEYPLYTDQAIYEGTGRAFLTTRLDGLAYEEKAKNATEARIERDGVEPTATERAIAEIATRENADPELVKNITEALGYGASKDANALREQRNNLLDLMKAGKVPSNQGAREYAKAVFSAFTHKEVEALMTKASELPESLPKVGKDERAKVAQTLTSQFAKIKGSTPAPSLQKAKGMFAQLARSLGLDRGGPYSGPDM